MPSIFFLAYLTGYSIPYSSASSLTHVIADYEHWKAVKDLADPARQEDNRLVQ